MIAESTGLTHRTRLLSTAAVALALALSACTGAPGTDQSTASGELTLVETKSPVQLLRNEALGRVDAQFVADVRNTSDGSAACSTEEENPGGIIRQWQSAAEIVLADDAHPDYVTERLVQSFTGDGWDDDADAAAGVTRLSSPHSVASIEISAAGAGTILISVSGPCVTTDGPDSEEVTSLG